MEAKRGGFLANRTIKHTRTTAQANQFAERGHRRLGVETRFGVGVRGLGQPLHKPLRDPEWG
jgi:hypothetical protein